MKKLKKILKVFAIIIGSAVAFAFVMNLINPFWFRFPKKIKTKEEMFSFVENNQEELEKIVEELILLYRESDEYVICIRSESYTEVGFHEADDIIKNYPVYLIGISERKDRGIDVSFHFRGASAELFDDPWAASRYWGIRYIEDGEPVSEMEGTEMEKQGDEYVDSKQGMYEYRTERVVGNWYYYQCRWFH